MTNLHSGSFETDLQTESETEFQQGEDPVGAKEQYHYHDLLLTWAGCLSLPPFGYDIPLF